MSFRRRQKDGNGGPRRQLSIDRAIVGRCGAGKKGVGWGGEVDGIYIYKARPGLLGALQQRNFSDEIDRRTPAHAPARLGEINRLLKQR